MLQIGHTLDMAVELSVDCLDFALGFVCSTKAPTQPLAGSAMDDPDMDEMADLKNKMAEYWAKWQENEMIQWKSENPGGTFADYIQHSCPENIRFDEEGKVEWIDDRLNGPKWRGAFTALKATDSTHPLGDAPKIGIETYDGNQMPFAIRWLVMDGPVSICVCGKNNSGKSSLVRRYIQSAYGSQPDVQEAKILAAGKAISVEDSHMHAIVAELHDPPPHNADEKGVNHPWIVKNDQYGKAFFYNIETQNTSFEPPPEYKANITQQLTNQVDQIVASRCEAVFLVFDVTDRKEYESTTKGLLAEFVKREEVPVIFLVANKCDLVAERQISEQLLRTDFDRICRGRKVGPHLFTPSYAEVSAFENHNVVSTFRHAVQYSILQRWNRQLLAQQTALAAERDAKSRSKLSALLTSPSHEQQRQQHLADAHAAVLQKPHEAFDPTKVLGKNIYAFLQHDQAQHNTTGLAVQIHAVKGKLASLNGESSKSSHTRTSTD